MAEKLLKTEDKKLQQVVLYEIVKLLKAENTQENDTEGHRSFESLLKGKISFFMLIFFIYKSSGSTTM